MQMRHERGLVVIYHLALHILYSPATYKWYRSFSGWNVNESFLTQLRHTASVLLNDPSEPISVHCNDIGMTMTMR